MGHEGVCQIWLNLNINNLNATSSGERICCTCMLFNLILIDKHLITLATRNESVILITYFTLLKFQCSLYYVYLLVFYLIHYNAFWKYKLCIKMLNSFNARLIIFHLFNFKLLIFNCFCFNLFGYILICVLCFYLRYYFT